MTTPQPCSSLFPYTTLFRSQLPGQDEPVAARHRGRLDEEHVAAGRSHRQAGRDPWHRGTLRRDRKSTRLNSSHVAISYAVFCLKKKIVTSAKSECIPHRYNT